MGGSISTIRWTPYGPLPADRHPHSGQHPNHRGGSNREYKKSKSYPGPSGSSTSPSSSTTNLSGSYDQDTDDDEFSNDHHYHSDHRSSGTTHHVGTSGILMGANAPPLYDACLVGRWDEVLEICGEECDGDGDGENNNGGGDPTGGSSEHSPNTATTRGSTEQDTVGRPSFGSDNNVNNSERSDSVAAAAATAAVSKAGEGEDGGPPAPSSAGGGTATAGGNTSTTSQQTQQHSNNHPCLQTRYADRRRNTPLHLACRRQPPPSVIRALLNHSPCEAVSRRTADGLTPLHFAAYCGAGVEVVGMLVDRMRSDAAVGRAMRLSSALTLDELDEEEGRVSEGGRVGEERGGGGGGETTSIIRGEQQSIRARLPSEDSSHHLPPTRLLDRRRRTPLHCALSGFRTPIRPVVVRKLLAVDPASATLADERGRTPLSLLFDDYAEEIMEALEDDVSPGMVRGRIKRGGELHECWKMLRVLLEASYRGGVSENEEGEEDKVVRVDEKIGEGNHKLTAAAHPEEVENQRTISGGGGSEHTTSTATTAPVILPTIPQDRQMHNQRKSSSGEVDTNVMMEMYDREHFSMVHAAAGVWECPAPLAKLVLKCLCGDNRSMDNESCQFDDPVREQAIDRDARANPDDWSVGASPELDNGGSTTATTTGEVDLIKQLDEETMRLPLHIAVCARPQAREGYSARLKVWLSTSPEASIATMHRIARSSSRTSVFSTDGTATVNTTTDMTLATHPDKGDTRGRTRRKDRVYNPRFGRSPSSDSVVSFHQCRSSIGSGSSGNNMSRSGSHSSISANIAREPFLQHTMVRDVLNLYPDAAAVVDDRTGKLPIVLAIEHGKSWETAVGPLLDAYPTPFGGGGDGGMALPDNSDEGKAHREALQSALFLALSSPESHVRDEAIRTAGKLAEWGGIWGMPGSLDGIVSEWLDTMVKHDPSASGTATAAADGTISAPTSPEGIVVGPGAASASELIQTQSSHLTAAAEVVSHSRPDSISDMVARSCLDISREYLYSRDGSVREAAARVLGNTLNSVGDADDAANVMRELVLNMQPLDESFRTAKTSASAASNKRGWGNDKREDKKVDVITKHGRLLACHSILMTQWGEGLMSTPDISDAIMAFIHKCVKDDNPVVRSAAYHAMGPILGKSPTPEKVVSATAALTLKELRSDILKGTRASERVEVQLALARGLTSASRMSPNLFLCKSGMPIMDAALMLAMSSSSARPNVQKAFQIFLWVALQMGCNNNSGGNGGDNEDQSTLMAVMEGGRLMVPTRGGPADDSGSVVGDAMMSPGLEKYIELAEGENGRIMMKFVTQTLAKIEDLDDQGGLMC